MKNTNLYNFQNGVAWILANELARRGKAKTGGYINISNWIAEGFNLFENSFTDGVNHLRFRCSSAWEKFYYLMEFDADTNYEFSFEYKTDGFTMNTPGSVFTDRNVGYVSTSKPSTSQGATNVLGHTNMLDNSTQESYTKYFCTFNSGSNTQLYVCFDFSEVKDSSTTNHYFKNVRIRKVKV